jgi:hypothetical protein
MSDGFTEITSTSWLQRLGQSIVGVLAGIVLFLVSFPVLFLNEGRAVTTAKSLDEGAAAVQSITDTPIEPAHDGKLVHATGLATTSETLTDPQFGVAANAIRLERVVEMYQYKQNEHTETRKKFGGGEERVTTYTYEKVWSKERIDSSKFKQAGHDNPAAMPYQSSSEGARTVTLGAFDLPAGLVSQIQKTEPVPFTTELQAKLPSEPQVQRRVEDGVFFQGKGTRAQPEVGDVRVTFQAVKPQTVSIIAQQTGKTFRPYQTKAGRALEMLSSGSVSAEQMFAQAQAANTTLTWVLRLVGFVLMAAGIGLVFRPLVVLADVVPFIGNILSFGVGIFAAFVALPLSLTTIAIGWIVYRPLLGVVLLVVAAAIGVGFVLLLRGRRAAAVAGAR